MLKRVACHEGEIVEELWFWPLGGQTSQHDALTTTVAFFAGLPCAGAGVADEELEDEPPSPCSAHRFVYRSPLYHAQAPALPMRSWAGFASAPRVGSAWSRSWLRWVLCSRMPAQACLRHRVCQVEIRLNHILVDAKISRGKEGGHNVLVWAEHLALATRELGMLMLAQIYYNHHFTSMQVTFAGCAGRGAGGGSCAGQVGQCAGAGPSNV